MSGVTFSQRPMKPPGETSRKITLTNKNTGETLQQSRKQGSSKTLWNQIRIKSSSVLCNDLESCHGVMVSLAFLEGIVETELSEGLTDS